MSMRRLRADGVEVNPATHIPVYTWAELPKEASVGTYVLLSDSWVAAGGLLTAKVSILLEFTGTDTTQPWEPVDGTNNTDIIWGYYGTRLTSEAWVDLGSFVFPAKITLRCKTLSTGVASTSQGIAWGLTSGAHDKALDYGGTNPLPLVDEGVDTTLAAGGSLHMTYAASPSSGNWTGNSEWRIAIKKMAGQA